MLVQELKRASYRLGDAGKRHCDLHVAELRQLEASVCEDVGECPVDQDVYKDNLNQQQTTTTTTTTMHTRLLYLTRGIGIAFQKQDKVPTTSWSATTYRHTNTVAPWCRGDSLCGYTPCNTPHCIPSGRGELRRVL